MIKLLSTMTQYRMRALRGCRMRKRSAHGFWRSIQRGSACLVVSLTFAISYLPMPEDMRVIGCWISIAASVMGLLCIAAYHWPSQKEGR